MYILCLHIDGYVRLYTYLAMYEVQQLIKDDLNKRSAKHIIHKSTLVARGADMQLDPSCVSAPLATNVDLWNPTNVCTAQ